MFKYLAALAIIAVLIYPFTIPSSPVDTVSTSLVRITGDSFMGGMPYECSGFSIGNQEILTANHCLGQNMKADDSAVEIIKADKFYDLALIKADTIKPALELESTAPQLFEPDYSLGYAEGRTVLTVLDAKPVIINYIDDPSAPPMIYFEGGLIPGMSGGPIVNQKGKVIAMCQQTDGVTGMGVGTLIMQAFMLGVR